MGATVQLMMFKPKGMNLALKCITDTLLASEDPNCYTRILSNMNIYISIKLLTYVFMHNNENLKSH
jgi:hypothetical protein